MADDFRFKIPESGLDGLSALISLGPTGVAALCESTKRLPLTSAAGVLTRRLSSELNIKERTVSEFMLGAVVPLNRLRVHLKLNTPDFLKALSDNLEREPPEKWRTENLAGRRAVEKSVVP